MDYAKIDRTNLATFLDVTPKESEETWEILGVGIQSYAIDFNPNMEMYHKQCIKVIHALNLFIR